MVDAVGAFAGNDCTTMVGMAALRLRGWNVMLANGIATFDEAKAVSDAVVAAVEVLGRVRRRAGMAGLQSRPQFKLTPLDVSEGRVTVDTVTRPSLIRVIINRRPRGHGVYRSPFFDVLGPAQLPTPPANPAKRRF